VRSLGEHAAGQALATKDFLSDEYERACPQHATGENRSMSLRATHMASASHIDRTKMIAAAMNPWI